MFNRNCSVILREEKATVGPSTSVGTTGNVEEIAASLTLLAMTTFYSPLHLRERGRG